MKERTRRVFDLLRKAKEHWSVETGNRDAFSRGSQVRKDIAEQLARYLKMLGRTAFLKKLEQAYAKHSTSPECQMLDGPVSE